MVYACQLSVGLAKNLNKSGDNERRQRMRPRKNGQIARKIAELHAVDRRTLIVRM